MDGVHGATIGEASGFNFFKEDLALVLGDAVDAAVSLQKPVAGNEDFTCLDVFAFVLLLDVSDVEG